jgi:hypothetical protein
VKIKEDEAKRIIDEMNRILYSWIFVGKDNTQTKRDEAVNTFKIIQSTQPEERKKVIHYGLIRIRESWSAMCLEKFEEKQPLEMGAYDQNMNFDQLPDDERDLIFAIGLIDFNLKLERNDIREVVNVEIYQAAC